MESTKTKILKLLRSEKGYLSGQELCEKLGVSRTAVWKYMKQLKEEGYQIQAVQNKGYCLVDVPDVLGESEIKSRLTTKWAGQEVYFQGEMDSTNTQAKRLAEEGAVSGTLVVTDCQSKGKGRRGRIWESPRGSSVYMTLLMRPDILPQRASMLTLVMGLSVAQAVQKLLDSEKSTQKVQIKWPNDVVLNRKKLVGILTEMSAQIDYIEYLVIGVGINVNTREFPEELQDKATSLWAELGHSVNRAELIAQIMKTFEENYLIFEKTQDLSGLMKEYEAVSANYQKPVKVLEPGKEYTGIARGINEMGELLVEREDHRIEQVYAGEVSVRGLYSYV
ncbi:MAG: biotin--[acetyl-CoA-carboxylase] ligase [Oliverpabstia sp.]|nr:biotin--[acetyl-CoA-carboxylase] ligase [Oliverpabstia sp.]